MKAIDEIIKENDKLQEEIEKLLKELQQTKDQVLFYKTILDMIKKENE
jgi:cell division septum initiation protein DivIVA